MGLSSVFSTAISGLQASETTIDVAGNNVANANTVGFKSSNVVFATQFLQTLGLGAAPSDTNGGVNPRQIGLGTQVAAVTPVFTQGTLEISSSPSDLAIQGDGFFIVNGTTGEQLFTRNGKFQVNSQNQLTTVGGERLLGFGVDDRYQIQNTQLVPLTIPLGQAAVAKSTENVYLEGTLTPTGDVADTPEILQSGKLSDGSLPYPTNGTMALSTLPLSPIAPASAVNVAGTGIGAGTYRYKIAFVDATGNETVPSSATSPAITLTGAAGSDAIDLTGMVDATTSGLSNTLYTQKRIYRIDDSASSPVFQLVATVAENQASYTDTTAQATLNAVVPAAANDLKGTLDAGDYGYYVTWLNASGDETRPTQLVTQTASAGRRIRLDNIPLPNPAAAGGFNQIRVYRSVANNTSQHYLVATLPATQSSYIDTTPDSVLTSTDPLVNPNQAKTINLDGPKITAGLALVNVRKLENGVYTTPFQTGTLSFTSRKGGRTLATKQLDITSTTTVQNLLDFMRNAMGIQQIVGNEGGNITSDGRLQLTGDNGVDNSLEIGLSGFQLTPSGGGTTQQVNLGFNSTQTAKGQSAVADFLTYDSLGIALNVRVTAVLESRTNTQTTYRWFADSSNNDPSTTNGPVAQAAIAVGTGTITFDGEGKFLSASNSSVAIARDNVPSASPLSFKLDFSNLSGLSANTASLAATRQDGFPPGKLASYIIGEDGLIRGVFDNGTQRDLGQIRLARFANPEGLEQKGKNLYAAGVNSGLPVQGNPGNQGTGTIVSGAVELSNTDIGKSLIQLISASTQYRGNARVITAAEQLLDELLNLRR